MIGSDNPDSAVVFQNTAGRSHPFAGIFVISGQAFKTVPLFINAGNIAVVRTGQCIAQLQIIRRIGKNQINRIFFHLVHHFNTIIVNNRIKHFLCLHSAHIINHKIARVKFNRPSMVDIWL